jgi:sirohydrochlorin ferrochelatase
VIGARARAPTIPAMLGLLLVDHGSRRAEANAQLEDMAGRVARLRPGDVVGCCHMEIAAPDIAAGFAALVARGATRVVLLPYLLGDGRHLSADIPRLAAAAAAHHPGVAFALGAALGPHDALARLLLERAQL